MQSLTWNECDGVRASGAVRNSTRSPDDGVYYTLGALVESVADDAVDTFLVELSV